MDHLMPVPDGNGSHNNFVQMNSYLVRTSNKAPAANDIYVGLIPSDVDTHLLHTLFSRFGEIDRIFEGRRSTPQGGMKWAFISYIRAEDAFNVLQQAGRIALAGSILDIRPRDTKNSASERDHDREHRAPRQVGRDHFHPNQMNRPPPRDNGPRAFPRAMEPAANPAWNPYPLLSKTLTVANIPPDFAPKDLYDLFSEFGKADGAFVYAFPDVKGRRVGEVAMATYLFAQKALEHMDGRFIEGYAFEVSYKPAVPIPQGHFNIRSPEQRVDYPVPIQMAPPPPAQLWAGPAGPNPFVAPPLPPISPPQQPPNFAMWQYANPTPMEVVQPVIRTLPALQPPTPVVAPEPSPPPPYSALPPIRETGSQGSASGSPEPTPNVDTLPPKAPGDPCNLFVKNLDDEVIVTQRDLEKFFAPYGTITSTFLATYAPKDDNSQPVSKGFGFVAFARAQEAEIAKDKLHGQIVGRKKIFVSYAERKEERHTRLKVLFANMETLADQMKRDIIAKAEGEEVANEMKDDCISSRGIIRSPGGQRLDDGNGSRIPVTRVSPQSPMRQGTIGQPLKYIRRGSPIRRQGKTNRRKPQRAFQNFTVAEPLIDIDFHEDFPPLPKAVKPAQSQTLRKITQAAVTVKEVSTMVDETETTLVNDPSVFISRPSSPGQVHGTTTPMHSLANRGLEDSEIPSVRSSVQGTPSFPRAPPPSSAELSTAGNTAPSTPTVTYTRPRMHIHAQSLHDRLLHANASLATLQEGRPLTMARSTPVSPLLGPTIFGDFAKFIEVGSEMLESLDTTIGGGLGEITVVEEKKQWTSASLVET